MPCSEDFAPKTVNIQILRPLQGLSMLAQIEDVSSIGVRSSSLQQPETSSSPDWQVDWERTERKKAF